MDLPILYLWRGLAADGGGAGRQRGGLSVGGVYKPHKTAGVDSGFGGRLDVPDSAGIFGGHLGALPHRVVVRDSDVEAHLAQGRVPRFSDLQGEVIPAADVRGVLRLRPTDVVWSCAPAAGGCGDPLDRPAEALRADLDLGAVTPEVARALYGAVLDADGQVNAEATGARREALRAERRQWPAPRRLESAPAGESLTRVGPLGDQLDVVRDPLGQHWTRCRCGRALAPAAENWRAYRPARGGARGRRANAAREPGAGDPPVRMPGVRAAALGRRVPPGRARSARRATGA